MAQILSTDLCSDREPLDYWREITARSFGRMEFEPSADPFRGTLVRQPVGACEIIKTVGSARVARRPGQGEAAPQIVLIVQQAGTSLIQHNGCAIELKPGDFTFCDATMELEQEVSDEEMIFFRLPLSLAPTDLAQIYRVAGLRIDGSEGVGAVASNFFRQFAQQAEQMSDGEAARLIPSLLNLVTTVGLAAEGKATLSSPRHRSFHLHRIYRYLNDNLRDPDLTPTKIAAAHGISRRYLSKLFEGETMSISRRIWDARLDRCRLELEDPVMANKSISDIAFGWGFNSASHFARSYKARFGLSPTQARSRFLMRAASE